MPTQLLDGDNCAVGDGLQGGRVEAEDGVGCAGGRPDFIILQQIFINEGAERFGMAQRGNAANDKASTLAHIIGIRLLDSFPHQVFDRFLVHPVTAAGNDKDGGVGRAAAKHQRLHNLPDGTTNGCGRVLSRARRSRQLDHLQLQTKLAQGILNFLGTWGQRL